jgi:tight adherence protein B
MLILAVLFFIVVFLLVALAAVGVSLYLQKTAANAPNAGLAEEPEADPSQSLFKPDELSSISLWHRFLAKCDFVSIMQKHLAQAELNWSVGRLTLLMLLIGFVTLVILVKLSWLPLWGATGGAWLASLLPYLYVMRRRGRRFDRFRDNFPDALDSLSRGLRAGYPLMSAMDLVANETMAPVSTEMRKAFVEASLGMSWNQVFANLSERMPLLEVNLFAAAVLLHTRTGGRLSDVITALSENMREQVSLRGEVRAIAAHGKLTGLVLTLVPLAIAIMMSIVSPSYIGILLGHPYGKDMIAAAVLCLITAHFIIRRIVDIKL